MLMRGLSRLFCRQKGQYRNSSINTTIDATPETAFHGAEIKSNGEICKNNGVQKANIPDVPVKPNVQDWTSSEVQVVIDQAQSSLPTDMTGVFKKHGSHIFNLPDEILLLIIKNLSDGSDKPSLFGFFVLRQVSQRFRSLMRDRMFRSHVFSDSGCCERCSGGFCGKWTRISASPYKLHCFESKIEKSNIDVKGLGRLIRRERICNMCRPEFRSRRRAGVSLDCKFAARTRKDWMYCCACKAEHPTLCFSREQAQKKSDRVCVARTGYIRICAHEVITWDEVQSNLGSGQDVNTRFKKVCKHPSHLFHHNDPRRLPSDLPSVEAYGAQESFALYLSSGLHSQEDLNETYFQGRGTNDKPLHRNHILPFGMVQIAREFDGKSTRVHTEKMAGQSASISLQDCLEDYECHILRYRRTVCSSALVHKLPGHEWYHAISLESYSYAGPCGVPETCSDPLCRNHYSSGLRFGHAGYGKNSEYNHLWRKKR